MYNIACLYQLWITALGCPTWLEFVETEANVADVPSRDPAAWMTSELAACLGCEHGEALLPDLTHLLSSPVASVSHLQEVKRILDTQLQ